MNEPTSSIPVVMQEGIDIIQGKLGLFDSKYKELIESGTRYIRGAGGDLGLKGLKDAFQKLNLTEIARIQNPQLKKDAEDYYRTLKYTILIEENMSLKSIMGEVGSARKKYESIIVPEIGLIKDPRLQTQIKTLYGALNLALAQDILITGGNSGINRKPNPDHYYLLDKNTTNEHLKAFLAKEDAGDLPSAYLSGLRKHLKQAKSYLEEGSTSFKETNPHNGGVISFALVAKKVISNMETQLEARAKKQQEQSNPDAAGLLSQLGYR